MTTYIGRSALAEYQLSAAAAAAPQVVQLERVVVSAKRVAPAHDADALHAAACEPIEASRC